MRIGIVIPCFNEFASLSELIHRIEGVNPGLRELWLVDDGSTDQTWWLIERRQDAYAHIHGVKLQHNRGHQRALLAGLLAVRGRCDCAITMDADGQHPPSAIPEFLEQFRQGADIVFGVRRRNQSRLSRLFYWWMGDSLIPNHGDFRLISARVLDTLTEHSEPFLRGLFSHMPAQFKTAIVQYDEQPRIAGRSTYTFRKRLALFGSALRWRLTSR